MSQFGVICPPATGHLNPMTALARTLVRRGHRVTFLQPAACSTVCRPGGKV